MPEARYVNPLGLGGSPQPFVCQDMHLYGFILEGDLISLQALCDKYLNNPSGSQLHYVPVTKYVMISFANIKRLQSQNPPMRNSFWMPESEVSFWVMVAATRRVGPVDIAEHLAWFNPYMWVDNPIAMIAGREIYGIPKQIGYFTMPQSGLPGRENFKAEALGVTAYGPDAEATRMPLFDVNYVAEANWPEDVWTDVEDAFSAIHQLVFGETEVIIPGIEFAFSLVEGVIKHQVQMVMLKQFPDVKNGELAAYQAVVEAPVTITKFGGGQRLKALYQFDLYPLANYPIVNDLGLKLIDNKADISIAFWLNYDFTLGIGYEVWRAHELPPPSGCLGLIKRLLGMQ